MAADTSLGNVTIDEDVEMSETKINNNGFCRLCAKEGGVISIFDGREDTPPLSEQAMLLAPIQISRDDSLPHLVCCPCSTQLVACYLFRQQCELADRQLRSPQLARPSTQTLLKQEDLGCEPDFIDGNKDLNDSDGTCSSNCNIIYATGETESNSRLNVRRFSCGRDKKDLENSCLKDKALIECDRIEGKGKRTAENSNVNEKTDFDFNSNKDDSRNINVINISPAKDNRGLDGKQDENKSDSNNDGSHGDLKAISELKNVTVDIEYDGGDSDTGQGGGDIDYVPGWCDSDEEKLFDTALRLSVVRSTQDWEIKKELEISNNGDRLENGRVEIVDNAGQQSCRHCGKQTTFIGRKADVAKTDDNDEVNKFDCECTERRLKRRGRHRRESHLGDAEDPPHIGEYASVGTPLLKVREDLYEDRGVPGSPELVFEDQEEMQLEGSKSKKRYPCQFCSKIFTAKHLLRKHQRQCTQSKAKALKSGELGDITGLEQALRLDPGTLEPRKKKERLCKYCSAIFYSKVLLKKHVYEVCTGPANRAKYPPRNHMCEVCGRTFKHRTVLVQHMSTHSGLKLHHCPRCNKSFTRGAHVAVHMRIHDNVKPYVCETCGRSFTKSSDLLRHKRIHSDARDYPCPLCHKAFKRSGDVASHMRSHTGDRPYKCEPCNKSYTNHSSLLKHRRNNCILRKSVNTSKDAVDVKPLSADINMSSLQTMDKKPSSPESLLSA